MVCCTLIAGLLALLIRPAMAWGANPLAWRPDRPLAATMAPGRAKNRLRSISHALDGLAFVIRNEPNMRIHIAAASLVVLAGVWLGIDASEWRWLMLAVGLVFMAEAFNTAVEQCCNAVSREYHAAIKAAKDTAAGAVLLSAVLALVIGATTLAPHMLKLPSPVGDFPSTLYCRRSG